MPSSSPTTQSNHVRAAFGECIISLAIFATHFDTPRRARIGQGIYEGDGRWRRSRPSGSAIGRGGELPRLESPATDSV